MQRGTNIPIIQIYINGTIFNAHLLSVENGMAKVNPICKITGPFEPSPSFVLITKEQEQILKDMLK